MCERNVFKEPKSNEADKLKRAQNAACQTWTGRSDKTEGSSHTKAEARSSHPKLEKGQVHTQSLTNCSAWPVSATVCISYCCSVRIPNIAT